jgi:uncharacterized protein YcbK (DUF882 family)
MLALIAPSGARTQSPATSSQRSSPQDRQEQRLRLYNIHTGERLDIVYRAGDQYIPSALAKLDNFLRDPPRSRSIHNALTY